jgi:hypothetical protein
VTVSVTPVGNVVILGVPVLSIDGVTDLETVVLEHLDPVGDGLEDWDRVASPVRVWLTDIRLVTVCLSLDVTVLDLTGVEEALVLPLKDADPDAVFVVDMDAVCVLDLAEEAEGRAEAVCAVVIDDTDVRLGDPEGVRVGIVVTVSVWELVRLTVFLIEAETVLEIGGVLEMGGVLVPVAVVEGLRVIAGVAVVVLVTGGAPVAFGSFVEVVDVVDVLDTLIDLVPERVLITDTVLLVEPVVVRLSVVLLVVDVVAVDERDWLEERVPDPDPVGVLDTRVEDVVVIVGGAEDERLVVPVNDGDDEDVLELVIVLETDVEADDVFEERMDIDDDGVAEAVLDVLTDAVPVLDAVVVLVLVLLLVIVLEGPRVCVGFDVELVVLETVAVRVAVVVLKAVIVSLALNVNSRVGIAVFVPVVVRVEVLECVADCEGATAGLIAEPVYNRPSIIHRRRMFIVPYNIEGDYY